MLTSTHNSYKSNIKWYTRPYGSIWAHMGPYGWPEVNKNNVKMWKSSSVIVTFFQVYYYLNIHLILHQHWFNINLIWLWIYWFLQFVFDFRQFWYWFLHFFIFTIAIIYSSYTSVRHRKAPGQARCFQVPVFCWLWHFVELSRGRRRRHATAMAQRNDATLKTIQL